MKKLIIISLVLAVALLFVSMSFAAWNEGGFKNSPLFKHSLKKSVESMENQDKKFVSGGQGGDTKDAKCNDPKAPVTYYNCETTEATCQGIPTCQQTTCFGTCSDPTCIWYETCGNTCESTCQSTCESTCQNTCSNCIYAVEGTVNHNYWGYFTNYWGGQSSNRVVQGQNYPYKWVNFSQSNGYYYCDEWGKPAQYLRASGKILNTSMEDLRRKPSQGGGIIQINFYCERFY
jgi:hypothetical protein